MASPFSTNELFLRSDRIAFGKVPPEVASREERLLIVPDLPGYKLFFGLSSLVSTSAVTGTLEAIYPQNASFTFDNQTKQLGIGISSPQYGLDIATTTGVRISGGMLIANALGLQSVPTAALISTLPASVFAPGSIPPTAIASTGTIAGISVPTSALFSTLPTQLFAPSSIPLLALQSSGIVYASSFIANSLYGDGYNVSNIPLANINADIVGNFFKPNTISLSSLASTGQLWIKDGSVLVPYLSAPQIITSSITANYVSSQTIRVGDIQASSFTAGILNFQNLSSLTLATSSILVGGGITANYFSGDGDGLTNLNPDQLNTVIPSDKFGYRLIAWDAINPYGAFVWIAGSATFEAGAPVTVQGTLTVNGATTLNTVTANLYTGNGSGLYNLNAVSSLSLRSTVAGLGTAGYLSTGALGVITENLVSTVVGLGSIGYISSSQLLSTISSLGSLGYVSTSQLTSTVRGLGSVGYISSASLTSSLISTTIAFQTAGFLSSQNLLSTVEGLGSVGYISSASLASSFISTTNFIGAAISSFSSAFGPGGGTISLANITSTVTGLGSAGYISSASLASSITSTTIAFQTSGFLSSANLLSTVEGLGSSGYLSTLSLTSSLISTTNFIGSAISSFSTAFGPGGTDITAITSTVEGLGSSGYISSVSLQSSLTSTTKGLETYISSFIDPQELASSVLQFISSTYLTSQLTSTVTGLGSAGYISTASFTSSLLSTNNSIGVAISSFSTAFGPGGTNMTTLASTVEGLGSIGYISAGTLSTALISTTTGLQRAGFISSANLLSTVTGLGSIGYLSTASLTSSLISTTTMIGLSFSSYSTSVGGSLATVNLTSTVTGLGSIGYVSTTALGAFLSTISTSYRNQFDTVTSVISALTVSSLTFGTGDGFLSMPDIRPTAMSTLVTQTSSLQAFNLQIGATSTLTAIQFYGLQGNFLNTVIAERSLAAGSQEFLVFKGSSSADQIRFQTTGIFEIETGVSSRLWSTVTQNATPSFIIDINSNVGIQTASPGATLDVAGTARAVNLSSQRLLVSSINDSLLLSLVSLTSTVTGLGSIGYISTPSLISTTNFVSLSFSSFSSAVGPGGGITTTNLQSTVEGLGSVGYISAGTLSTVLISTTNFISLSFSSFSTGIGGGGGGGLTTGNLTSTVAGLGTVGYLSSIPSILSTSAFFTSSAVISTATIGIMSSLVTNASTANINIATTSSVTTNTITIGTGGGWILTSPIQTAALSTNTLWADTSYVTTENVTTGIISTVTTNNITLGTGGGWLATSPIQTSIVSSIYMFANQPYFDTVNIGSVSTMNSLEYYGLFGNYNNTVLAEISTGGGTQELLVFKGSSSSDRVRVQTTGNFVVETGVSARLFNSNTIPTLSNATPAFIVNTSSNVGIQTASPGATLDVAGTGRFVLVSTQQLNFSSLGNANLRLLSLSTGYTSLSSLNIIDPFNAAINFLTVSSGILLLNGSAISGGGGGGAGVSQIVAGTNISISPVGGTGVVTINSTGPSLTELYSTVGGLGSIGYISSASMASSFISTTNFIGSAISSFSTAFGPGGISLVNITSTVEGLGSAGYISAGTLSTALISTTIGLQTAGFLSSANLLSTVGGLGSIGYISTASLISTTSNITYSYGEGLSTLSTAIYSAPFIYPGQLLYLNYGISTGLTSNYRALQTTPTPLNAGYLVTTPLAGNSISTVAVFQSDFFVPTFIPAGFWENRLFAYASGTSVTAFTELYSRSPAGVETLIKTTSTATTTILPGASPQENIINMNVPYTAISTGYSIVWKVFGSNANAAARDLFTNFENGNTYSYLITTFGGTAGYNFPAAFSTLALFTSNTSNYFSSQIVSTNLNLISTVGGLGSSGYVSSASLTSSLVSTTVAFQTAGFISSANLLPFAASLGSLGYISSASLTSSLVSTTVAFQTAGFLSSANLLSTVGGLGSIGYVSTTRLISTVVGLGSAGYLSSIPSTLSTSQFLTSSVVASSITTSSLQVNSLTIGTGTGWVNLGPLQTVAISSIQDNTNALYANTSFFGTTSTATALQFYGLFGNYNNTVLAEVSTGAGTQELLAFKGSSSSDRVRVQTTGAFVVETGVSARLWSGTTIPTLSNTTPAFIINSSSNVGIQTASPGTALDVVGTARATILSSLAVYTSSLFAPYVFTPQFFTF